VEPGERVFAPHVVIIGGGFGGLATARALGDQAVRLTLVDRSNHYLFQPLLYQVALAALSPAEIAVPIRSVLARQRNATILMAEVSAIELGARRLLLDDGEVLTYDFLVIAAGAETNYYGHSDWAVHAPGLKSIEDALEIRRRVLIALERAERELDDTRRRRLLSFVVIGGGPTGVELAGAISELARTIAASDFRRIDPSLIQVTLLEMGDRILAAFDPRLSGRAVDQLRELGVQVRTGARVTAIDDRGVWLGDELLPSSSILWTAGVRPSPLAAQLGVPLDRGGRVIVGSDCSIPGHPEAFAIGDIAAYTPAGGATLPGVSPVAMQEGRFVARTIVRSLHDEPRETFAYVDKGTMATIGRSRAVAQIGALRLHGLLAWLTWLFVHLWYLIGFHNRLAVFFDWCWAYLTFRHGARLITGRDQGGGAAGEVSPPSRPAGATGVHSSRG
jgi:NADH:ubiquinone reductase (H+-translocating)